MAEKLVYVCDVCGASPAETVTFRIGGSSFQKDYCSQHLGELREGGRKPRRGRRPGTAGTTRPRKKASGRKKSTSRKSTRRKSPGRRRKSTATRSAPEAAAQSPKRPG